MTNNKQAELNPAATKIWLKQFLIPGLEQVIWRPRKGSDSDRGAETASSYNAQGFKNVEQKETNRNRTETNKPIKHSQTISF